MLLAGAYGAILLSPSRKLYTGAMLVNHRKIRKLLAEAQHTVGTITVTARAAELARHFGFLGACGLWTTYVRIYACLCALVRQRLRQRNDVTRT